LDYVVSFADPIIANQSGSRGAWDPEQRRWRG
jgi:hypothetical protein